MTKPSTVTQPDGEEFSPIGEAISCLSDFFEDAQHLRTSNDRLLGCGRVRYRDLAVLLEAIATLPSAEQAREEEEKLIEAMRPFAVADELKRGNEWMQPDCQLVLCVPPYQEGRKTLTLADVERITEIIRQRKGS